MNVRMVDAAVDTLREVDVVVLVFDASTRPGHGDEFVSGLLEKTKAPVVLVLNKVDLIAKSKLLPLIAQAQKWHDFKAIIPVSAQTGDGVDRLERVLMEQLPEGEALYPDDYLTDQPERTLVAETVRERSSTIPARSCRSRPQSSSTSSTKKSASGCCGSIARFTSSTTRRRRSSSAAAAT